jgi:hypothetical protein
MKEQTIKIVAYSVLIIVNLFNTWWCLFISNYPSPNLFFWWLAVFSATVPAGMIIQNIREK